MYFLHFSAENLCQGEEEPRATENCGLVDGTKRRKVVLSESLYVYVNWKKKVMWFNYRK